MASASNQIRSTKTYLWYISDVLGTGATSTVYKGRHKKTGDLVAAKAFNSLSFMRPQSVQQREFDVLLKLNHPNIVKLYDIEQDQISKNPVIIMELCSGGSLYNILDDPRNSHGIEEEELKRVLGDVCAGMKHLRDLDIVHRDIKPGNIMKVTSDDGTAIYKLADFGAARELQDDENFVSLYGTEEYLHPDLYERAVLRQPSHKAFSARIDLWSLGVTFYHVATGALPFRPFGGRKNRETMFQITTKKASGVISAVQRESVGGPIEYSRDLPQTCRLSSGLKKPLVKILRGLLESKPDKMWTFNRFFDEVQALLTMKVIDVFHVSKSHILKVYVEPKGTLAEFQEHIAEQTGVQAMTQVLLWERDSFYPDASQNCESYPVTSVENPIILMEKGKQDFPMAVPPVQPKLPKMSASYDIDKDASMAKIVVAVLYYTLSWLQNIVYMEKLMTTVAKAVVSVLKAEIGQLDYHCVKLKASVVEVSTRLYSIQQSLPSPLVCSGILQRKPEKVNNYSRILGAKDEVERTMLKATQMAAFYNEVENLLMNCKKEVVEEDRLSKEWAATEEKKKPCTKCMQKFAVFTEEAEKIYGQFKKHKQLKQLSYNEEQIHKMDKEKLNIKSTQAMSICHSHCEKNWTESHGELSTWHGNVYRYRLKINLVDRKLTQLIQEYQTFLQEVHMLDQDIQPHLDDFSETLVSSLTMDPAGRRPTQEKRDSATNTDSILTQSPVSTAKVLKEEGEDLAGDSSLNELLKHMSVDENGCVLIPRSIKAVFETWEREIDSATRQMEQGQEQLYKMQQMSLSMLSDNSLQSGTQFHQGLYGPSQMPHGASGYDSQVPGAYGYSPVRGAYGHQ
ncbi:serine/threonine-protein kinase TBK1-like [Asterias amurensis]|uniref:serine/threonine-protein kinase TBK1-like n=1 Tax=Asterias amurensis TaxID=7602 RepID=UPI003AB8FC16